MKVLEKCDNNMWRILQIFDRLRNVYMYARDEGDLLTKVEKVLYDFEWNECMHALPEHKHIREIYKRKGIVDTVKMVKDYSNVSLVIAKKVAEYICADLIKEKKK